MLKNGLIKSSLIKKPELIALTSLRGIAALFVMAHHFMFVLLPDIGKLIPSRLFFKSYLWVDLFFVLSGFVLAYVYQQQFQKRIALLNYRQFMLARFARIYPLHFFILSLFVFLELAQSLMLQLQIPAAVNLAPPFTSGETPSTLLSNLLLLQSFHWNAYWNQPAWSISAEWLVYFTVPFLICYLLTASKVVQIASIFLVFLALIVIEQHYGTLGYDYAGWPMLLRCFGECILGVIAMRAYQENWFMKLASGSMTLPLLALTLLLLALPISGVISVVSFVWLVLCAARIPQDTQHCLNWSWLVYIGKISFSIYMVHWLVLEIVRSSFLLTHGQPVAEVLTLSQQMLVFVLVISVVILIAHYSYQYVENAWRKKLLKKA
jgi:peptidoglycan/LPS O-acetylase OafA/YrhL